MVNVPLLRKTLEHITAHPEEWEQRVWAVTTSCGTAMCLAGTACILSGEQINWDRDVHRERFNDDLMASHLMSGELIEDRGRDLLGLDVCDAYDLFHPSNTLRDLWTQASDLTDGEIEVPGELPDGS